MTRPSDAAIYLTVVFRAIDPESVRDILKRTEVVAMSRSHAIRERDAFEAIAQARSRAIFPEANESERTLTSADAKEGIDAEAKDVAAVEGFYLASFKRDGQGYLIWWMPNNAGYTSDLDQAGVYTELTPGYHDSDYTVPVPVRFIDQLRVRRMVDQGDSLNGSTWNAEKLRAAIASAPTAVEGPNG